MSVWSAEHRVVAAEIDWAGVAHFSNHLIWTGEALMDLFSDAGLGRGSFAGDTVHIRVGRARIVYSRSVTVGDTIRCKAEEPDLRHGRMVVNVGIVSESGPVARARLTVAFVDARTGRLVSPPDEVLEAFARRSSPD